MPDPHDDAPLSDKLGLWRRVLPAWVKKLPDGSVRLTSLAFKDRRSGRISLHRADLCTLDVLTNRYPGHGVVEILVQDVRDLDCDVLPDPTLDDPSHAVIEPHPTKSGSRELARRARWVIAMDQAGW